MCDCYICGLPCKLWLITQRNTCKQCAIAIYTYANESIPISLKNSVDKIGDSFYIGNGSKWIEPIDAVKAIRAVMLKVLIPPNTQMPIRNFPSTIVKKTYTHECPCGLVPSTCEYHKS